MKDLKHSKAYIVFLLMLIFSLFSLKISAQTISGTVVNEKGENVPYANVMVLSADSVLIEGTTTDENGHFQLKNGKGNLLKVTCVGYKTDFFEYTEQTPFIVKLATDDYVLNEVTVKSKLPQTQLRGEGMITTVEGTILEKLGTIENVLDRIPGLMSQNGSVTVIGRGSPLIYINGRKMKDWAEMDRIRPDQIKSVEVISNPGARYAASVSSVIRIITKKTEGEGWSFSSKTDLNVNEYKRTSGMENLFLNYRTGGWDFNGTLAGNYGHTTEDKHVTQKFFLEDYWQQSQKLSQEYNNVSASVRLETSYQFNPNNTVGVSTNYTRLARSRGLSTIDFFLLCNDELAETGLSNLSSQGQGNNVSTNAFYVGRIGNIGIDFNADYYWNTSENNKRTDDQYTENLTQQKTQTVLTSQEAKSHMFASKLVLSHPLFTGNVSLGGEFTASRRIGLYGVLPTDLLDDEDSRVSENMYSAFVDYTFNIKKLFVQAGLRCEHLNFKYYDHGQFMDAQSKNYTNWFPSLALSMPVGKTQMSLTYASDIGRPSYHMLREGIQYNNRYAYESGNPFLLPLIARSLDYVLTWKWLYANVSYTHVSDQIDGKVRIYMDNPKISLSRPENLPCYNQFVSVLSVSPSFGRWNPMLQIALSKQWNNTETPKGEKIDNPNATFYLNNTFETRWFTFCLVTLFDTGGSSKGPSYYRKSFSANVFLYKRFFSNRLLVQFYATDILGTADKYMKYYSGALSMSTLELPSVSQFSLTVRYHFNIAKSRYKGTGAGQSQKSRL